MTVAVLGTRAGQEPGETPHPGPHRPTGMCGAPRHHQQGSLHSQAVPISPCWHKAHGRYLSSVPTGVLAQELSSGSLISKDWQGGNVAQRPEETKAARENFVNSG